MKCSCRSREVRPENWPLHSVIARSLVTVTDASSGVLGNEL